MGLTGRQLIRKNKHRLQSVRAETEGKAEATDLQNHAANTSNPHVVTKSQVGLGLVPNVDCSTTAGITDSTNKRFVSDAQRSAIDALGSLANQNASAVGVDIEFAASGNGVILRSSGGSRFRLGVTDGGALTITAL